MYSTITKKKCKCSYCGKSFERDNGQVNRANRNGAKLYCSMTCLRFGQTIDLTGKVFGRLTVIEKFYPDEATITPSAKNRTHWRCLCECGNERVVLGKYLMKGDSTSCGCHSLERSYGQTKNPEYCVWSGMKHRCYDKDNEKYPDYGARGITVCDRWLVSFSNFLEDMGKRTSPKHTIDRRDNDGNYEKSNCRWATSRQQTRNKRNNHWIEHNGMKMIMNDWAEYFGIDQSSLHEMLKRKKSFEEVYNYYTTEKDKKNIEFNGLKMRPSDWARYFNIHRSTLTERIEKGQSFEFIYNFYKKKNGVLNDN